MSTVSNSPLPPDNENDRTVAPAAQASVAAPGASQPSTESEGVLPIGTRFGELEIIGLIGQGGFGIVYLCDDHALGRRVAVKEYMPSSLAQRTTSSQVSLKSERFAETFAAGRRSFVNEARLLAQFDHPSLVKVYRFWEANGTAYMVMPYYDGQTLKQARKQMPAAPDEAYLKRLLGPLLDALEAMHHEQIFHRDIAPDNILLLKNGRPLLLDFGAARHVISDMTQALTVILKPGYAPIEQYAEVEHMKQGAWTDIYALAAVLHFAITGKPPLPSVSRVMSDPYVPLTQAAAGRYSDQFLRAVDGALAVEPENRPQNVAEFRQRLGIEAELVTLSATEILPRPAPQIVAETAVPTSKGSAKTAIIAGGAMALVVTLSTAAYFMLGTKPEPPALPTVQQQAPPQQEVPKTLATPPVVEAERSFQPIDELDAIFQKRDREHNVSVQLAQAQVRIGRERLRFRVSSSRPGYVYVMMLGTDREHFFLLFPNDIDRKNHIAAGGEIDLPRPGWSMVAGGPAGTNHLVAVVTENPRDFSEAGLIKVGPFAEFPFELAKQRSRGETHSPFLGKVVCADGSRNCSSAYGAAVFTIEEVEAPGSTAASARRK